ncbi:hypothetical protein LguiB_001173 [Lonicera macranthoides]
MTLDLNAYKEYNLYVKEEEEARKNEAFMHQEFKIPSAAEIKKKYVDASPAEIKEKMLKAFIAHLGFLDDDSMSISSKATSKAPSVNLEEEKEETEEKENDFGGNEDMEKYMGMSWADQVEAAMALNKVKKEKKEEKNKGKGTNEMEIEQARAATTEVPFIILPLVSKFEVNQNSGRPLFILIFYEGHFD